MESHPRAVLIATILCTRRQKWKQDVVRRIGSHLEEHRVDEAMENIREAITVCMEEESSPSKATTFIGWREVEVTS